MRSKCFKVRNKKLLVTAGIIFTVALTVLMFILIANKRTYDYIGKVNGEPISAVFFKNRLIAESSNTYSYFYEKHGAEDCADFWIKNYGGEVPIKYAREKALSDCVRIMVQQEAARQKGIIPDRSYKAFLENLKQENERRKEAVSKGKVIFGPMQYNENDYFNYVFSNMVIKLKEKLEEKELQISDKELSQIYDTKKRSKMSTDQKYEELVNRWIKEAKVEINQSAYENVYVR